MVSTERSRSKSPKLKEGGREGGWEMMSQKACFKKQDLKKEKGTVYTGNNEPTKRKERDSPNRRHGQHKIVGRIDIILQKRLA